VNAPVRAWLGFALACSTIAVSACRDRRPLWERESVVAPLPAPPLGVQADFTQLPFAVTPQTVRLGRWLFFDPRLSAGGGVSCASCHKPELAFSETTPVSTGIAGLRGTRKAPSLVNVAWPLFDNFFRDGRSASLTEQALGPLESPFEMGSTKARTVAAISALPGYRRLFREGFGDERLDIARIAAALAAYEATRMSGNSAFDRFDNGDARALNEQQQAGRAIFYGKAACTQCHLGWNFTDTRFHNLGVGWDGAQFRDLGRAQVTNKPEDRGAFKTPTLRDVARHPPYMHDGSLPTLRSVIELYNRGGVANPSLALQLHPLGLTEPEIDALVAFLESLNGTGFEDRAPAHFPE
jgi:cytochrome c peroxidase